METEQSSAPEFWVGVAPEFAFCLGARNAPNTVVRDFAPVWFTAHGFLGNFCHVALLVRRGGGEGRQPTHGKT